MQTRRYPTVFIVAFCAGCIVLAALAGSIADHDVALSAIALVGWFFIIGLFVVQIRVGWMRQKVVPRTRRVCAMLLFAAIAATTASAYLAAIVGSGSWWRLPTGIVALSGIAVAADCVGALFQMMKHKLNTPSQDMPR